MKKIEKTALILIILYAVSEIINRAGRVLVITLFDAGWSGTKATLLSLPLILITLSVNIAISIWLFRKSKSEGFSTPWVWALLGFIFRVTGAILFYTVLIYKNQKKEANQRVDFTVKTPVDEVEVMRTESHP